ncbi:cysteine-rich CWC family protein [Flavihumibacter solisilvae]|uniref:cysteine-rich CWC family protein n=1 Tax=Flavihumibacter solisilvae TaxID=1349421 RepID=UPI000907B4A8|nr:cysteine-rich CWC family protein [Flavihumibacter solisilvae]
MTKHEQKCCSRCEGAFECRAGDIAHCQCNQVSITRQTTEFLQRTSHGCLCSRCLSEINQLVEYSRLHPFVDQAELLIPGLHFYVENGGRVYTELYHIQRGSCCGKNCRHCAYGNTHLL